VYLGIQAIRHRRHTAVTHEAAPPRRSHWRILGEGFVVGLTNPKSLVFFVAVLPQFVDYHGSAIPLQLFELGVVFLALALIFDSVWALAAGTARQWFGRSPKRVERLGAAGGVMMIGLGGVLAFTGVKH
jgi:threonine/homoserine/homoserine lactone efflux protein